MLSSQLFEPLSHGSESALVCACYGCIAVDIHDPSTQVKYCYLFFFDCRVVDAIFKFRVFHDLIDYLLGLDGH